MTGEPTHDDESALAPHPILLYDGVCALCNWSVQFILRRDPHAVFRFAALQNPLARRILTRHGADAGDMDTVYVVIDYETSGERIVTRSDAVIFVLKQLAAAADLRSAWTGGAPVPTQSKPSLRPTLWRLAAILLRCMPRVVRDLGYRVVARTRYHIFGRYDTCPTPTAENQARFLDT